MKSPLLPRTLCIKDVQGRPLQPKRDRITIYMCHACIDGLQRRILHPSTADLMDLQFVSCASLKHAQPSQTPIL